MNNKEFFYEFKNEMGIKHFEFYNILFSDGYLVEGEKDSVIQFKIKGLDNWLFGAWIEKDETSEKYLEIFCQYEMLIDKFKPSRGSFDINVKYYENDFHIHPEYDFDTIKLEDALTFMKKHEAIFFCRESDPYIYIPEWKAKIKMAKCVSREKRYQRNKVKTYELIQNTIKWAYKFKIFQTMYDKDDLNDKDCHINDVYYIYVPNFLGRILSSYLQHRINKFYDLGDIWVYNNKAVWMAEYNGMKYDEPPVTEEEIMTECSDIKEKQKIEYKRQYDRLIKYV